MLSISQEKMSNEFSKYLINIGPFHAVLHHFTGPDKGGPHDHPWSFTTHVLKGGYWEQIYIPGNDGEWHTNVIKRIPGTVHKVSATCIHEIIELPAGECWTIVIPGPKERESRFWKFDQQRISSRLWNETDFKLISTIPNISPNVGIF